MRPRILVKSHQNRSYASIDRYLWIKERPHYIKYIHSGDVVSLKDRLCSGWQYLPQFALYSHKTNVKDAIVVNLFDVVKQMQSLELENLGKKIIAANAIGDKLLKAQLKSRLPYITHSGIFIPRRNDGLIIPGFTYGLDIDKILNADEILAEVIVDRQLTVLFACKSVSGNGVKAMLFLKELLYLRDEWYHEEYKVTYHRATDLLSKYFQQTYQVQIDTQMKAISQPFYLFYASNLFIGKSLRSWI